MKQYCFNDLLGCVVQRHARQNGKLIGVYHGEQSGMESDPDFPWVTVCEEHSTIATHPTLSLALSHASDPQGWCEQCMNECDNTI